MDAPSQSATHVEDTVFAAGTPSTTLQPGAQILVNGDRLVRVPDAVVAAFQTGDRLLVADGAVLHVPRAQSELAKAALEGALHAFTHMVVVDDAAITRFYELFAGRLADATIWSRITAANERDVAQARMRGRPTTRLAASERMRQAMIDGLRQWQVMESRRGLVVDTILHEGWEVEQIVDGLGVIGFVFEGRPNVFADATGILRSGNTAVMRIGGDALGTAQAIATEALAPALREAGLPGGAITLLESTDRAAGWALFADTRLALAVARGSGTAVAQLGSIARQAGTPVSLHGTGGAWLIADETADLERFRRVLYHSLDRKVCNTVNVVLVPRARAGEMVAATLDALRARGEALGHGYKLHVAPSAEPYVPAMLFSTRVSILRAEGPSEEPVAESLAISDLGLEWEWEVTPELSLAVVADLQEAIRLFNAHSPHFIASLISEDPQAHDWFFRAVDAPFVGDGFTRWVDGQYALNRPELGLSNWQFGRLLGRAGVLSGDSAFTLRLRVRQRDLDIHR